MTPPVLNVLKLLDSHVFLCHEILMYSELKVYSTRTQLKVYSTRTQLKVYSTRTQLKVYSIRTQKCTAHAHN